MMPMNLCVECGKANNSTSVRCFDCNQRSHVTLQARCDCGAPCSMDAVMCPNCALDARRAAAKSAPLNVVPLPVLNLGEVTKCLRTLADRIDAGDHGAIESCVVMLLPWEQFAPLSFCYGDNMNRHRLAGTLLHAANLALTDPE